MPHRPIYRLTPWDLYIYARPTPTAGSWPQDVVGVGPVWPQEPVPLDGPILVSIFALPFGSSRPASRRPQPGGSPRPRRGAGHPLPTAFPCQMGAYAHGTEP